MRIPLVITSIAIVAFHGAVSADSLRACAHVSTLVDEAVLPLLTNTADPQSTTELLTEFRSCLSSHNICGVVYDTRDGREALVAGDVTADLPTQYASEQRGSAVPFLVRSIPRVRNDSNRYCLISARFGAAASGPQWDVYGWVIAANGSEPLPLEKQALDSMVSDPRSLRGLAAALWFFAERMSGQPAP